MPLPALALLIPFVETVIASTTSLMATGWATHLMVAKIEEILRSEAFKDILFNSANGMIRDLAAEKLGVTLDPENPLSKESLSTAITTKTSIEFQDITDAEQVKSDVGQHVTGRINTILGTELENVMMLDAAELKAQFQGQVIVQLQTALVSGTSTMFDATTLQMIVDQCAEARGLISTGIPPDDPDDELDSLRLRNRLAQRKHYAMMKAAGYSRKYVPNDEEPPPEEP